MAETYEDEMSRLKAIEKEYRITLRVMAVLVANLAQGKGSLVISDDAVASAPDITAWRDESRRCTVIAVDS